MPRKNSQPNICNLPHPQIHPQSLAVFFLGDVPFLKLRLVLKLSNDSLHKTKRRFPQVFKRPPKKLGLNSDIDHLEMARINPSKT